MSHIIKISNLEIGYVGNVAISVPIVTIGEGKPHIALLCGVHGDETASLILSYYFIQRLKEYSLNGSVSIITAANPFAQATRTRVIISDFYDLNRIGQGKPDGVLTERLAYRLCEYLLQCSFIVDIHEFVMDTPTMAIYIPSDKMDVDRQNLRGISAFSPSTVWALEVTTPEEAKYSGALLSVLISHGIPGFAIETSRASALSKGDIQKVVEGLLEVAKLMHVIDGEARMSSPSVFSRNVTYSNQAGIWIPKANLMSQVRAKDKVGGLTSLNLNEQLEVFPPVEGVLIQIRSSDLVDTGTALFTIGVSQAEVSNKFRSVIS